MKRYKPPQQAPREDLSDIVATHLHTPWQRPIAAHSRAAFDAIRDRVEGSTRPLIIDSAVAPVTARAIWLIRSLVRWCWE